MNKPIVNTKPDIVTLGEIMLRLSAPPPQMLEQASQFNVHPAGSESNVAITASRMGARVGWISALPNSPPGRLAAHSVQAHGVDISRVVWKAEGRIGLYFLDAGVRPRSLNVIYDRARSVVTDLTVDDVDWDYVRATRVFHVSGITPALSPSLRQVVSYAVRTTKEAGILTSFDLNYRAKLWSPEHARAAIEPLLPQIDILRAGLDETRIVLGLEGCAGDTACALRERYGSQVVIITDEGRQIAAFDGSLHGRTPYPVETVDPIGAGDAFTAGFLVGFLERGIEFGLDMAVALGALKHTYAGDIPWCTREEVLALIEHRQSPPR